MQQPYYLRWALVIFGASIAVGEGLAWICAGFMLLILLAQGSKPTFPQAISTKVATLGALFFILISMSAWLSSGLGIQHSSRALLRLPWIFIPILFWTLTCLQQKHRTMVIAFVGLMSASCILGLLQYYADFEFGRTLWRGSSTNLGQLRSPEDASKLAAGGFFHHRLKLAHLIVVSIPLSAYLLRTQSISRLGATLIKLSIAFQLWALWCTSARAALGLSFLVLLIWALAQLPAPTRVVFMALGTTLFVAAALSPMRYKVQEKFLGRSGGDRSIMLKASRAAISDHPFGIGLGNFEPVVNPYIQKIKKGIPRQPHPHNQWVHALVEGGPLGLLAYLSFQGGLFFFFFRRRHTDGGLLGISLMVGWMGLDMVHDIFFHPSVGIGFSTFIGFALWATRSELGQKTSALL